jgi:hypothetical protein
MKRVCAEGAAVCAAAAPIRAMPKLIDKNARLLSITFPFVLIV